MIPIGWVGVQLIGLVGLFLIVGSFQLKRRKAILQMQLSGNVMWVVHFMLIGATTGAALNAVSIFRAYMFYRYGDTKSRLIWLLWLVCGMMVAATVFTWQGVVSLLPMSAVIIATIAFWQRDEQNIRKIILASSPLWFCYSFLSGSYAGMISEIFVSSSALIGLWRYRKIQQTDMTTQKTT